MNKATFVLDAIRAITHLKDREDLVMSVSQWRPDEAEGDLSPFLRACSESPLRQLLSTLVHFDFYARKVPT